MYKVGEYLIHKREGVCLVNGIETKDYGNGPVEYYVMHRHFARPSEISSIMVPINNCDQIKDVISFEEASNTLKNFPKPEPELWSNDNRKRKEVFGELVANNSIYDLCRIYATITMKKQEFMANKKNLPLTDNNLCNFVLKMISEELAIVLNKDLDEIIEEMNKNI